MFYQKVGFNQLSGTILARFNQLLRYYLSMTIEEIKIYMKKNKITYQELSDMSNIPITTLKDIFRGAIKNPRIDTFNAIETALGLNQKNAETTALNKIIQDLKNAGLTEERYNAMTEEQRQDFLQLVKIMTKKNN